MASCKHLPLYEKWGRAFACNNLPLSLTCVLCKLLEHIVCSNIMAGFHLLSDRQHAFRIGHSCETQLTAVINDLVNILDKEVQVETFILDLEKAFDHRPSPLPPTPPHTHTPPTRPSPLIKYLKANYLVVALAERHSGG